MTHFGIRTQLLRNINFALILSILQCEIIQLKFKQILPSKAKTSKKVDEKPKRKGTITDILKRERELRKEGIENEAIDELLEKEFGETRLEKVKASKTWKKHHIDNPQDESIAIKA